VVGINRNHISCITSLRSLFRYKNELLRINSFAKVEFSFIPNQRYSFHVECSDKNSAPSPILYLVRPLFRNGRVPPISRYRQLGLTGIVVILINCLLRQYHS
jgi:hypothetical protein